MFSSILNTKNDYTCNKVKNKMKTHIIGAIIVGFIIIGSSFFVLTTDFEDKSEINETIPPDYNPPPLGNITSFDEAVNAFAFNLYREFYKDPEIIGNIFNSPYSIFTALAMTYEGAKNLTAEEMASVLNIKQDNESFHRYMQTLYAYLNENSEYNISTANALWPREDYKLLQEYIDVIETYYGGKISEVDYSNPEKASEIINSWVENQTNNLIQNLVPPSVIDPFLTVLILTNAIYFKGIWEVQFDEDNTTDREFTTTSGDIIDVQTMCLVNTQDSFNYTENNNFQILELPYNGNEISMMIFLPKEDSDLSELINSMNKDGYSELIDSMTSREVDIYLPKFKIKTPLYTLNDYLKNLGMPTAFGAAADFSGLDGVGGLYISKVLHKAFIEVNEEGTEAAAATAVVMFRTSMGDNDSSRVNFVCNHPFLFTIHHKETGTILFMGTVDNPIE